MSKVIDIKFLKVEWKQDYRGYPSFADNIESRSISWGLDKAHTELETKIKELLSDGWVLQGDVVYRKYYNKIYGGYLVQTMVKYETPKVETNLLEV